MFWTIVAALIFVSLLPLLLPVILWTVGIIAMMATEIFSQNKAK